MKTKIIQKSYKFRIYPTLEQIIFFSKTFGCVRKVYNLIILIKDILNYLNSNQWLKLDYIEK